jgi:DnaK suppressor protein
MKKKLLARRVEMTQQLTSHGNERVFEGQVKDSGDEVLSLSLEKLQNSLQQTEIDEINLIEQALSRIEKGEYGLCIDCGEAISNKRLEHYPYAARCIVCQEALEE